MGTISAAQAYVKPFAARHDNLSLAISRGRAGHTVLLNSASLGVLARTTTDKAAPFINNQINEPVRSWAK